MKKYTYLLLLVAYFVISSGNASCFYLDEFSLYKERGPYLGFMGGMVILDKSSLVKRGQKSNPGYYIGGYLGYRLPGQCRVEAEISYQQTGKCIAAFSYYEDFGLSVLSGNAIVKSWSYIANGIYEIDIPFPLKPYVGLGIGYAQTKIEWKDESKYNFLWGEHGSPEPKDRKGDWCAFQPIIGCEYQITKYIKTGIDYRFLFIGQNLRTHKVGLTLASVF